MIVVWDVRVSRTLEGEEGMDEVSVSFWRELGCSGVRLEMRGRDLGTLQGCEPCQGVLGRERRTSFVGGGMVVPKMAKRSSGSSSQSLEDMAHERTFPIFAARCTALFRNPYS